MLNVIITFPELDDGLLFLHFYVFSSSTPPQGDCSIVSVVLCAEQQVSYIGANKQLSDGRLVSSAKLCQRPRLCLAILVRYLRFENDIRCCTCYFLCGGIGFTVLPVGSFSRFSFFS